MPNLHSIKFKEGWSKASLSDAESFSVVYHDIFDYPLDFAELIKWRASNKAGVFSNLPKVVCKNGYYFVKGREGLIYKRSLRKRISEKKIHIAQKASKILSFIPWVSVVAITGSLSMKNSDSEGDIDLLLIVKKDTLWFTRLVCYFLLFIAGIGTRRSNKKVAADSLCLNMWFDESDLVWKSKRNVYTSHEIAQTIPLVNKGKTFERFLQKNSWITGFWPNAVRIPKKNSSKLEPRNGILNIINSVAYGIQFGYMKGKITHEIVKKNRAIFHPFDWSKVVLDRINNSSIK